MPVCDHCGEEIEFRYLDGRATPIHVNGGWCAGYDSSRRQISTKLFGTYVSYVNPNARCPVCNEKVFFYQSPYGGRVFFDDLGWPWPKHGCTDNPHAQNGKVERLTQTLHKSFRTTDGEPLRVFERAELTNEEGAVHLKLTEVGAPLVVLRLLIAAQALKDSNIRFQDLESAPAFVVQFYGNHRLLEFISGRKQKIDTLTVPREM